MKTEIVKVTEEQIRQHDKNAFSKIARAGEIIKKGGLVAFPTETVYGLGGDALNPDSSGKIYAAKGRPSDNPLIVHIAEFEDLKLITEEIPEIAYTLAKHFWPGPLTMIFRKSNQVPKETTGGLDTVAVRMPRHKTALELIKAAGGFVAAPSANISGRPSPTLAKYVQEDMDGRIDMIIDGGIIEIGLESTIIDLTEAVPIILRPGFITREMLQAVIGEVQIDRTLLDGDSIQIPKAPGMKYRHYAPKGELTIVEGEPACVAEYINKSYYASHKDGKRVGVIATMENMDRYHSDCVKCIGSRQDEEGIAKELYRILREFDDEGFEVILSESFHTTGMGQAIMNRLLKAAGHKKIQV